MASDSRFAVLIDADNVSGKYIKLILDEISKDGVATYKRIYGDWTNPALVSWKSVLLDYSVSPIQQYSYTTGKNSTDSAMIIDAMDILYSGKVEGFCLVSSDSDFTRLAARLRESGMTVIGMGESKTPNSFIAACNKFKYLDILSAADEEAETEEQKQEQKKSAQKKAPARKTAQKKAAKEEPKAEKEPKKPQPEPIEEPRTSLRTIRRALRTIVRENSDEDNWIMVSQVGNLLDKRYPRLRRAQLRLLQAHPLPGVPGHVRDPEHEEGPELLPPEVRAPQVGRGGSGGPPFSPGKPAEIP